MGVITHAESRRDNRTRAVMVSALQPEWSDDHPRVKVDLMVGLTEDPQGLPAMSVGSATLTPEAARRLARDLTSAADASESREEHDLSDRLRRFIGIEDPEAEKAARLLQQRLGAARWNR